MGMRPRAGCHSRDKKWWTGGRTARVIRQTDEVLVGGWRIPTHQVTENPVLRRAVGLKPKVCTVICPRWQLSSGT